MADEKSARPFWVQNLGLVGVLVYLLAYWLVCVDIDPMNFRLVRKEW